MKNLKQKAISDLIYNYKTKVHLSYFVEKHLHSFEYKAILLLLDKLEESFYIKEQIEDILNLFDVIDWGSSDRENLLDVIDLLPEVLEDILDTHDAIDHPVWYDDEGEIRHNQLSKLGIIVDEVINSINNNQI